MSVPGILCRMPCRKEGIGQQHFPNLIFKSQSFSTFFVDKSKRNNKLYQRRVIKSTSRLYSIIPPNTFSTNNIRIDNCAITALKESQIFTLKSHSYANCKKIFIIFNLPRVLMEVICKVKRRL